MSDNFKHKTVLAAEVVDALAPKAGKTYLDVTFGGGGHSKALLEKEPNAKIIGLDWDKESLEVVSPKIEEEFGDKIQLFWGNFAHVYRIFQKNKLPKVDGVIADFGTSQHQIFGNKGLSFDSEDDLDMRMSKAHFKLNAADVVNCFDESELSKLFWHYSQEKNSKKIAHAIVERRKIKRFKKSIDLADLIDNLFPGFKKKFRIHPATRVFQALRIFVNKEMENIELFLKSVIGLINPGGKVACISFHSLEDGIVKHFFKDKASLGILKLVTKKPVIPSDEEIEANRSSRSAKLRVAEIL